MTYVVTEKMNHNFLFDKSTIAMSKINGNLIAKHMRECLKEKVKTWKRKFNRVPGLAVILVGERKDSLTYVSMKEKAASEIGINFSLQKFPCDVSQREVLECIDYFNKNVDIDGIIVQLPLPEHIDVKCVCQRVSLEKDVDGLRVENLARIAIPDEDPHFIACTPKGCIELIKSTGCEIQGKKATVVGRSHIVGMPMALLLNDHNATVSICHHLTPHELLIKELADADIVVVAVGIPSFVKGEWLKPGCVVIDVGINAVDDPTKKRGYRLVGDVDYNEALKVASAVTPVPGGVGPMTVAMLLSNTVLSFERTLPTENSIRNMQ